MAHVCTKGHTPFGELEVGEVARLLSGPHRFNIVRKVEAASPGDIWPRAQRVSFHADPCDHHEGVRMVAETGIHPGTCCEVWEG